MSEQIEPTSQEPKKSLLGRWRPKRQLSAKQEKNKDREFTKELKTIYSDSEGNMPNLTTLEFKPKNIRKRILILAVLILAVILAITILGFFIFNWQPIYNGNNVGLEIKAPFTTSSGDKINYQLHLSNHEKVNLSNCRLTITFPDGFIFTNSNLPALAQTDQQNPNLKIWQLNDLFIDQDQILDINGTMIGSINSKQNINAVLSYQPVNFSSEFQKSANFTTEITDSLLSTEIIKDSQVANGDMIDLKVTLKNKSTSKELADLELDLAFTPEFNLLDSQILDPNQAPPALPKNPKAIVSPASNNITVLLPLQEKILFYRGKFNVPESKSVTLTLTPKLKGLNNQYVALADQPIDFDVIKGDLLANLIIQGSNLDKPVNFGDTLTYLLSVANKSAKTMGDVKVRLVLDSPVLDWKSLADKNNGVSSDNQILWTKDQISGLAMMLQGDEVEIPVQINIKNYSDLSQVNPANLSVKSFFEAQINKLNNQDSQLVNQSNTITNQLNTNLNLKSDGRYFGDHSETLGSGPLPPIVGQKTTYRVFWTLTNSLHEISNIEVVAKLPANINLENQAQTSTGDISLNKDNEIVWQISRIPTSINQSTAEFSISLTPQTADVAKILTLLQDINLSATDSQTKAQVTLSVPGLTTNLDSDPLGKGKGLIQAE